MFAGFVSRRELVEVRLQAGCLAVIRDVQDPRVVEVDDCGHLLVPLLGGGLVAPMRSGASTVRRASPRSPAFGLIVST